MKKKRNFLTIISSLFGVFAICGLSLFSILDHKKDNTKVEAINNLNPIYRNDDLMLVKEYEFDGEVPSFHPQEFYYMNQYGSESSFQLGYLDLCYYKNLVTGNYGIYLVMHWKLEEDDGQDLSIPGPYGNPYLFDSSRFVEEYSSSTLLPQTQMFRLRVKNIVFEPGVDQSPNSPSTITLNMVLEVCAVSTGRVLNAYNFSFGYSTFVYRDDIRVGSWGNDYFTSISRTLYLTLCTLEMDESVTEYQLGYSNGFTAGYDSGYSDGSVNSYQQGYNAGLEAGNTELYAQGYQAGYNEGFNSDSTAITIMSGIFQVALVPLNFFLGIFNFEILGVNLSSIIQALFTIALTIIVLKMVIGRGGD